jgi:hypothetical protein
VDISASVRGGFEGVGGTGVSEVSEIPDFNNGATEVTEETEEIFCFLATKFSSPSFFVFFVAPFLKSGISVLSVTPPI